MSNFINGNDQTAFSQQITVKNGDVEDMCIDQKGVSNVYHKFVRIPKPLRGAKLRLFRQSLNIGYTFDDVQTFEDFRCQFNPRKRCSSPNYENDFKRRRTRVDLLDVVKLIESTKPDFLSLLTKLLTKNSNRQYCRRDDLLALICQTYESASTQDILNDIIAICKVYTKVLNCCDTLSDAEKEFPYLIIFDQLNLRPILPRKIFEEVQNARKRFSSLTSMEIG